MGRGGCDQHSIGQGKVNVQQLGITVQCELFGSGQNFAGFIATAFRRLFKYHVICRRGVGWLALAQFRISFLNK
jgi:hypothetical protein